MKTQQHLTPSQVEELRELGVEFEDTTCYWALCDFAECSHLRSYEVVLQDYLNSNESLPLYTDKGIGDYDIPAPSLQEVMEKLPSFFQVWNEPFEYMQPFDLEIEVYHTEAKFKYGIGYNSHLFYDNNPLLASFELLKWVAINHPELLTENK